MVFHQLFTALSTKISFTSNQRKKRKKKKTEDKMLFEFKSTP